MPLCGITESMQKELSLQVKATTLYLNVDVPGLQLEIAGVERALERALERTLSCLDHFFFDGPLGKISNNFELKNLILNLELCSKDKIIKLNSEFREKNRETDVLSFPTQDNYRNNKADIFISEVEIGDIFICADVCKQQAIEFKISFEEELVHLLVHGFLHLCGFDHELSEKEEALMEAHEKLILDNIANLA